MRSHGDQPGPAKKSRRQLKKRIRRFHQSSVKLFDGADYRVKKLVTDELGLSSRNIFSQFKSSEVEQLLDELAKTELAHFAGPSERKKNGVWRELIYIVHDLEKFVADNADGWPMLRKFVDANTAQNNIDGGRNAATNPTSARCSRSSRSAGRAGGCWRSTARWRRRRRRSCRSER